MCNDFVKIVFKFYLAATIILLAMVFIACGSNSSENKDNENFFVINVENVIGADSNIVTVKAGMIASTSIHRTSKIDYEVASAEYKNGGFRLNLPETVPDEWLNAVIDYWEDTIRFVISDTKAKVNFLEIGACNQEGIEESSRFWLEVEENDNGNYCDNFYIYADRNFTITVKGDNNYNCIFKKGWNIVYSCFDKDDKWIATTQKPSGINFKWYFYTRWVM